MGSTAVSSLLVSSIIYKNRTVRVRLVWLAGEKKEKSRKKKKGKHPLAGGTDDGRDGVGRIGRLGRVLCCMCDGTRYMYARGRVMRIVGSLFAGVGSRHARGSPSTVGSSSSFHPPFGWDGPGVESLWRGRWRRQAAAKFSCATTVMCAVRV